MTHRAWLLAVAALVGLGASPAPAPDAGMRGFLPASRADEEKWEREVRAGIEPARIRSNMETLSARPHHTGSEQGRKNAEWMLARFREWGWDARIETFEVLFPTPKERAVELLEPVRFTAKLEEPALAIDPTSGQKSEQLPTYNAYSIDGDATAPLVYVNFGVPADYEELDRLGVSVAGKIVIARYGGSWRGIKAKVAAEHGAVGCLIYSDPRQDGYFEGDAFPAGPFRPRDGVQRGSVADMPLYPGDPETPGTGSVPGASRLPLSKAATLTKIPVLPISAADAEPLLRSLTGPIAPEAWRGALPISYHVGPGASKVHLLAKFNWEIRPIRDVVARMEGSQFPDQWVIRGNHHDAWVNGADDPVSGLSAMLEEARGLGELAKKGWRPKRTIVYCAWDGEEPGLLGSTEWAETHAEELSKKAVAYINSDNNRRGFWRPSASQTLQRFFDGVAQSVEDPEAHVSIARRLWAHDVRAAADPELWEQPRRGRREEKPDPQKVRARADTPVEPLGSGSDYTVFLDHLGIASADFRFDGEDSSDGVYHSIYDDFYWYTHFSDTDFVYGRALAQAGATSVMRLANADLLPFGYEDFSEAVSRYVIEIKHELEAETTRAREWNREIEEGVFAAVEDPRRPTALPKAGPIPPDLDFAPLERACLALARSAREYEEAFGRAAAANAAANAKILGLERLLLSEDGLPGRPWFRNQIYAPGFYTGYGVKTLPAVREAVEQKNWKLAQERIPALAKVLEREARGIAEAADLLK